MYVQDYRLWAHNKHMIREYARQGLKERVYKTALHIRRGDYLNAEDYHTNLWKNTDYYHKAISLFPDDEQYLVFCMDRQSPDQDEKDREWCKEALPLLIGDNWELAPIHEDEVDDLNLMASCKSIIGANSTFSWMAAFIGDHDKVVMPEEGKWFTDGKTRCHLLPEWTKI